MSQLPPSSPPPPYGSARRPPGFPPPGYPPPPGPGYGQVQPQPKTSSAAVASLVLGLLGCVPVVTSLLAVVFGLVGFSASGKPMMKGRGFAVTGLLLGLFGLVVWVGGIAMVGSSHVNAAADEVTASRFVADLAAGRVDRAVAACQPGTAVQTVQATSDQLKTTGTLAVPPVASGISEVIFGHRFRFGQSGSADPVAAVIVFLDFGSGVKREIVVYMAPGDAGKDLVQSWDVR